MTGFAAGTASTVLKTLDGGESWISQSLPLNTGIEDIWFINENIGLAVGGGHILRTSDGGNVWEVVEVGPIPSLYSMHFADSQTGYAVGMFGTMSKTTDAGVSWQVQQYCASNFRTVYFPSSDTGYVMGNQGVMMKTVDGGSYPNGIESMITGVIDNNFLMQNHPNPFTQSTTIEFEITKPAYVSLMVFDQLGKKIASLIHEEKQAGVYKTEFQSNGLPPGIYYYSLSAGKKTQTKKLIIK